MPRPVYSEEAPPPQLQYREAPQLADQYRQFGSEEFQRNQDQLARNAQSDQNVRQMDVDSANKIGQGITQGVQGGVEAYDKAKQRQRQDREEQRQNMVTEEQLASSKQSREQSAELHPLDIASKEGAISGQKSANQLSAVQADEAQKTADQRNAVAQKVASLPDNDPLQPRMGETNREHLARMDTEKNTFDFQTAKQGLENAKVTLAGLKHQLATSKDLAPLQKQALQTQVASQTKQVELAGMDLNDRVLAKHVKGAKNEIIAALQQNPNADLTPLKAKYDAVNPSAFAEGLNEARQAGLNSKMLLNSINAANPDFVRAQGKRYAVEDKAQDYKKSVANLYFNANKYKNSSDFFSDAKGDTALKDFQDTLRSFNNPAINAYADRLNAKFDVNESFKNMSRGQRMMETANQVKKILANQIANSSEEHPKAKQFAKEITDTGFQSQKKGKDVASITGGGDPAQFSVNNIPGGGAPKTPTVKVTNNGP